MKMFGSFSVESIRQGQLGNCYFLSAVGVLLLKQPDLIKRLFYSNDINNVGCYSIWLIKISYYMM